jgi:hypothetical protein
MCTDFRCTDGITECDGCNGWGVITGGGRKYKRRSGARTIPAAQGKRDHVECVGSGVVVCGCRPVSDVELSEARGALDAVAVPA